MREYGLTILVAAAITYLFTPLVRRFAIAVGAEHKGRARDVHTEPVPLLGGIAMYLGLAAALLVASRLTHLSTVFMGTRVGSGLLLAGGVVVLMGFVDDRWGLGAITKLAGQVAAGAILVWSGAVVAWLPVPGGGTLSLTSDQQTVLTILVVVVTINAVNFIDGLDGLAAGIVGIGAAAFFLYYYTLTKRLGLDEQTNPALASAILAGVCLGFLPHNFHPARIFMGDTGSMLLGLLLAYAPISSLASLDPNTLASPSAYSGGTVNRFPEILPLLVPAIIMLIPYADLLLAVARRTRAGQSPFSADKKHLQHRLLAIGHSHRASVLLMYLWAALFAGTVVLLSIMRTKLLVLVFVTLAGVLVLLLASMPRLRPWNRRGQLRLAPDVAGPVPASGPGRPGAPARPGGPGSSGQPGASAGAGSSAGAVPSAGTGSVPGLASPVTAAPPGSPVESRIPAAAGTGAQSRGRADRGTSLDRGLGVDRGAGGDPGAAEDRWLGVGREAGGDPGPGSSLPPGRGNGSYEDARRSDAGYGASRYGDSQPGPAGLRDAGHGNGAGSPEQSRPGSLWDGKPAPAGWDGRRAGSAWDARSAGSARDADPAGPGWDADPAASAWDLRPAEQSRPGEAVWDSVSSAPAWDAKEPEARPSAGAWPAPGGLTAPSNGAPALGATSSGASPSGPAERREPAQWYPGRPDAGRPEAGLPDAGLPDAGRPAAGLPDAGFRDPGVENAGQPDSGRPDSGQWYSGRPDPGQRDSGWWDARPHDDPRTADPRDASLYAAPPPEAGQHATGPQDLDPLSPGPVRDQPGAPRATRPVNRDGDEYDEDSESPLLPWRRP